MQHSLTQSLLLDAGGAATQATRSTLPLRLSRVAFAVGETRILDSVDLEIEPGSPTVLIGPNGAGKTTLLKVAMGLIEATSGQVTFGGARAAPKGSRAIVFQKPVMLRRSVGANIGFALAAAGRSSARAEIMRLLELARISHLAERPARRLSGGEVQRLALARALARSPELLLLDEPTASLDPASTKLVEEIIAQVAASGVKVLMSTHDLGQARRLAGDIVLLANGRVAEHVDALRFFTQPESEAAKRFVSGELVI